MVEEDERYAWYDYVGMIPTFDPEYPEDDLSCECCGKLEGCECKPCLVCGNTSDPYCYTNHGMVLNAEEKD